MTHQHLTAHASAASIALQDHGPLPPKVGNLRALLACMGLIASLALGACGGGETDVAPAKESAATLSSPPKSRSTLVEFLYEHTTARVRYWPSWDQVPTEYSYLRRQMVGLPAEQEGVTTGLFSITYDNTNLPQLSLHIRRPGNKNLLVYNHGHGGVPSESEPYASEFLSKALHSGHDLLIASLPLVGLNAVPAEPSVPFFISARDRPEPVAVDSLLLTEFWSQHAIFEVINDLDSYIHFFVDGAVIPTVLATLDQHSAPSIRTKQVLPYAGPKYTEVNFVGLSGGATSGLAACAVHAFERCILIAGVMPDYLRVGGYTNFGDIEQQTRSFYGSYPVSTLMAIAAANTGRMTLIYNKHDTCCFADPAASQFQTDFPGYDIRVTEIAYHGYVVNDLLALLRD